MHGCSRAGPRALPQDVPPCCCAGASASSRGQLGQAHAHCARGLGHRHLLPRERLRAQQVQAVAAQHGGQHRLGLHDVQRHAQAHVRATAKRHEGGALGRVGLHPALRLEVGLEVAEVHALRQRVARALRRLQPVGVELQRVRGQRVEHELRAGGDAQAAVHVQLHLALRRAPVHGGGRVQAQRLAHHCVQVLGRVQRRLGHALPVHRRHLCLLLADARLHAGQLRHHGQQAGHGRGGGVGARLQRAQRHHGQELDVHAVALRAPRVDDVLDHVAPHLGRVGRLPAHLGLGQDLVQLARHARAQLLLQARLGLKRLAQGGAGQVDVKREQAIEEQADVAPHLRLLAPVLQVQARQQRVGEAHSELARRLIQVPLRLRRQLRHLRPADGVHLRAVPGQRVRRHRAQHGAPPRHARVVAVGHDAADVVALQLAERARHREVDQARVLRDHRLVQRQRAHHVHLLPKDGRLEHRRLVLAVAVQGKLEHTLLLVLECFTQEGQARLARRQRLV
mmetsp:Transcript_6598/g.16387  ORF Transcript_6598/g.16387 Transcript_6598/m.16387 type:complete len:509 (-) Transcript_6598:286-1812(-)